MTNIKELEQKYKCCIDEDIEYDGTIFYTACIEDNGLDRFCYAYSYLLEELEDCILNAIKDMDECERNIND